MAQQKCGEPDAWFYHRNGETARHKLNLAWFRVGWSLPRTADCDDLLPEKM